MRYYNPKNKKTLFILIIIICNISTVYSQTDDSIYHSTINESQYHNELDIPIQNIGLSLPQNFIHIEEKVIQSWYEFENNEWYVSFDSVYEFINQINKDYSAQGKLISFSSTYQGKIDIPTKTYGWHLDCKEITEDLIDILNQQKESFIYTPRIVGYGNSDVWSISQIDTYIEIDLTQQMLLIYKQNCIEFITSIVSGHPDTPTKPGVYRVWEKKEDTLLEGINNITNQKYKVPVRFWVAFDDTGQGIHDASWLSYFGGQTYKTNGSLGCINISPGMMAEAYSIIEEGMPVFIIN